MLEVIVFLVGIIVDIKSFILWMGFCMFDVVFFLCF